MPDNHEAPPQACDVGSRAARAGAIDTASGGEALSGTAILLAWAMSIIVHAALFVVMFMVPWLSGLVDASDELPIARTDLLGPLKPRTRVEAPQHPVTRSRTRQDELNPIAPKTFKLMSEVPGMRRPELSVIGIGTGGGDASKYGLHVDVGQSGPTFFGIGSKARGARRIVYVVDRSGSMTDTIFAVKRELKRSIRALRGSQRFHIIFYNAGEPLENEPEKLVRAASGLKENAFAFIDSVQAEGSTNPLRAVQRAFAVRPDLIYFLSDGEIPMASELLLLLEKLNEGPRKARIFTIAYVNPQGAELLEKIARSHDGEYRYVRDDELFD